MPDCPGGSSTNYTPPDPVRAQLLQLADILGFTDTVSAGVLRLAAMYSDFDGPFNSVGEGRITIGEVSAQYVVADNVRGSSEIDPFVGHWLIRAIPEPSTALLLGFGLAGLAVRRRRRWAV